MTAPPAKSPPESAIVARAPIRICLFGGGTDVNPYAATRGGAIVNVAIDLSHRVTLHRRPDDQILVSALGELRRFARDELARPRYGADPRFDLMRAILGHFAGALPGGLALVVQSAVGDGCGLGTSGSAAVAVVAALSRYCGRAVEPGAVARLAFELETEELGWAGGKQDQWAAAFGGLCLTRYGPGEEVTVEPLDCGPRRLAQLRDWLLLVHVGGGRRASAALQVTLQHGMRERGDQLAALDELKEIALEAAPLLARGELAQAGELAHRGWEAKKRSNPAVTNDRIDAVYRAGRAAGALGGKLIGAGGAGYLYLLCPPAARARVRAALGREAAPVIDGFSFDLTGVRVDALNG